MDARRDRGTAARKAALDTARWLARSRRRPCVTIEDVLSASIAEPEMSRRVGSSRREALRAGFPPLTDDEKKLEQPESVWATTDLLDAMNEGDGSLAALVDACLVRSELRGESDPAPAPTAGAYRSPPEEGKWTVRIHDEATTPMDVVVRALMDVLGFQSTQAMYFMYLVHHGGHADCGHYDREEAEQLAKRITEQAAREGHRLRAISRLGL